MAQSSKSELTLEIAAFVARWGEVGRRWGLARTAAEIHGLLLAAEAPMSADEIMTALGVARSNVSTSLRDLQALGVIRPARAAGDRKGRFEALPDPWEAAARIAAARKAREFDPALAALADAVPAIGGAAGARLADYAKFAALANGWADALAGLEKGPLKAVMKAGGAVAPAKKKKKKKG